MKKLILTALAALTATASAPTMADQWYAIRLGDTAWSFINLDSIKCKNDICTVWEGAVNIFQNASYDTELMRYQVDCMESKTKAVFNVRYLSGKQVRRSNIDWEWKYAPPGSVAERAVNATCYPDSRKADRILFLDKPLHHEADKLRDVMRKTLEEESKK